MPQERLCQKEMNSGGIKIYLCCKAKLHTIFLLVLDFDTDHKFPQKVQEVKDCCQEERYPGHLFTSAMLGLRAGI